MLRYMTFTYKVLSLSESLMVLSASDCSGNYPSLQPPLKIVPKRSRQATLSLSLTPCQHLQLSEAAHSHQSLPSAALPTQHCQIHIRT